MAEVCAQGLSYSVGGRTLLHSVSLGVRSGELVALLGPNGAGKTTLVRCLAGLAPPGAGTATLDGLPTHTQSPAARARQVAYLPQARALAWPLSVRAVVALGRFAYGVPLTQLKGRDADAVERALSACGLNGLAERRTDTLSGGETARVHIARALAAETPLLIADEPVAALDPRHQVQVMDLIRGFVDAGGGALVVLHDIALAAHYSDRLAWMKDGALVADGAPKETLTPERIGAVYGVQARVAWMEGAPPAISISGVR